MSFLQRCVKTASIALIALPLLASCATDYGVDGITDIGDYFTGDDDRDPVPGTDSAEAREEATEDETEQDNTEAFTYDGQDFIGSELLLPPDLADTASESLKFRRYDEKQETE